MNKEMQYEGLALCVFRYILIEKVGTFPVEGNCLEANRLAAEPDVHVCYTVVHM